VSLIVRGTRSIVKPVLGFTSSRSSIYFGLISSYLFNEGGGLTQVDSAKNETAALSGTLNWTQGPFGPAVNFNGGKFSGFRSTALDPLTIAFWANFSSSAGQGVVQKGNITGFFGVNAASGWFVDNNSSLITFHTSNGLNLSVNAGTLNTWNLYCFYWDFTAAHTGGGNNDNASGAYVNGRPGLASNTAGSGSYISDVNSPLIIGLQDPGSIFFGPSPMQNGLISSFMAWNRIISPAEAWDLYTLTYPSLQPTYFIIAGGQLFLKTLTAATATMDATLTKQTSHILTAAMHTFDAVLSTANVFGKTLAASMATMDATLTKQTNKLLTAAMHTFDATLTRVNILARTTFNASMATMDGALAASLARLMVFNVSMNRFAATLLEQVGKATNAAMATFAATLTAVKISGGNLKTFNASMSTFDGSLTFGGGKTINASMSLFNATLSLAVQHGTIPPECIPANCDLLPTIISHVEICDQPGS